MSNVITKRLPHQLCELEASVRAVLPALVPHNANSIDIEPVYCPEVFGPAAFANAIAVRLAGETEHRDLILYPVHPGSQSEISVGVHGFDIQVDELACRPGVARHGLLESSALFHSRFAPLPASWPQELYCASHRILVQLDTSPVDEEIVAILAMLETLQSSSDPQLNPENSSILLTYLDANYSTSAKRACEVLNLNGGWRANTVQIDRLSDYHAVLGNATLALNATEAQCADALVAGIPCLAWDSDPPGKRLHSPLDIQFANAPLHGRTRIAYTSELQQLLQQWLPAFESAKTSKDSALTDLPDAQALSTVLTPAVDIERHPELSIRLSRSLGQGQRKFRKFRESPGRFINDSQSPLLRPFRKKHLTS